MPQKKKTRELSLSCRTPQLQPVLGVPRLPVLVVHWRHHTAHGLHQVHLRDHPASFARQGDGPGVNRLAVRRFFRRGQFGRLGVHLGMLSAALNGVRAFSKQSVHEFEEEQPRAVNKFVDHARRKHQVCHGGGLERVSLDGLDITDGQDGLRLLHVNEALDRLALQDPAKAEIVKLRFFAGLENREIAEMLGLSERTVERAWRFAKAWLLAEFNEG